MDWSSKVLFVILIFLRISSIPPMFTGYFRGYIRFTFSQNFLTTSSYWCCVIEGNFNQDNSIDTWYIVLNRLISWLPFLFFYITVCLETVKSEEMRRQWCCVSKKRWTESEDSSTRQKFRSQFKTLELQEQSISEATVNHDLAKADDPILRSIKEKDPSKKTDANLWKSNLEVTKWTLRAGIHAP